LQSVVSIPKASVSNLIKANSILANCSGLYKRKLDIKNTDGTLLKYACIVQTTSETYEGANEVCSKLGMKLFVIDSDAVLISAGKVFLEPHPRGCFWFNGKKSRNGKWFTYDHETKTPIYKDLPWIRNSKTGKDKGCLMGYVTHEGLIFDGFLCAHTVNFICEF
jgi:hypothetical protein